MGRGGRPDPEALRSCANASQMDSWRAYGPPGVGLAHRTGSSGCGPGDSGSHQGCHSKTGCSTHDGSNRSRVQRPTAARSDGAPLPDRVPPVRGAREGARHRPRPAYIAGPEPQIDLWPQPTPSSRLAEAGCRPAALARSPLRSRGPRIMVAWLPSRCPTPNLPPESRCRPAAFSPSYLQSAARRHCICAAPAET